MSSWEAIRDVPFVSLSTEEGLNLLPESHVLVIRLGSVEDVPLPAAFDVMNDSLPFWQCYRI